MFGISREEFDMLRGQVGDNATRLTAMDNSGTRGVNVLAAQVTGLVKDIADLRQDFRDHEREHEQLAAARVSGRRWALGFAVAGLASFATVITLLLDIAASVH